MAAKYNIPLWKKAPFVRILLPFFAGIVIEYYNTIPIFWTLFTGAFAIILFYIFHSIPLGFRYTFQWLQGLLLNVVLVTAGMVVVWQKDIKNNEEWYGQYYNDSTYLIVKINEPLIEKEKSYKAEGIVESIFENENERKVTGKVLLYFSKESAISVPTYGDKILIKGGLQQIKNTGNPGGFNYSRYMAFQQTYHQVFLKPNKFATLPSHSENVLFSFIFYARKGVVNILQKYVQGNKKVTGIAEALLIGYKEDLDKDVVQAYSNTGVVHIIAISGMHLGLIYVVLVWLFSRLPLVKKSKVARAVLILSSLWLFSLITGGSASVLRSAVMFTCIVIGKDFFKQASIYNSLATSAFLLLCYNPFLLWDVGFQLSYCAVVGIVWLQKPIENLYYSKHSALRYLWQMCSITLAAQVLTLPVCIYYFHQIPTLFLFTNIICVPLSTVILFTEILLVIISPFAIVAAQVGKLVYLLTWLMNTIIESCNKLPFSLIDKIYATPYTTVLLYLFFILGVSGLLRRNIQLIKFSLSIFLLFTVAWSYGKIGFIQQKKIIVYNVSRHTAVDFVAGNKYWFYGDEEFKKEGPLQNFNLKPTRVSLQVNDNVAVLKPIQRNRFLWQFFNKKMILIDSKVKFESSAKKLQVDVLLITKNPNVAIADLTNAVAPDCIVFDGSNSLWKITQWKKECSALHLRCFATGEAGAFVLDAN